MKNNTNQNDLERMIKEEEIDLRQYWRTINRYKWQIFGLAMLISLITALAVFAMKPVYRATSMAFIEPQQLKPTSIEDIYSLSTGKMEYFQTQYEILKSRTLAESVITKLDLLDHPEFTDKQNSAEKSFNWRDWLPFDMPETSMSPAMSVDLKRRQAVESFLDRLTIKPVRKTYLVKISFDSYDAEMSAKIANEVVQSYIENNFEARLQVSQNSITWLSGRIGGLKENLDASEKSLQAFREKEKLLDVAGVHTLNRKELETITSQLAVARRQRDEASNIYQQVNALKDAPLEQFESISAILHRPLVQKFKEAENNATIKAAELSKRYGPKHPKLIAARSQLQSAKDALRAQIGHAVNAVRKEYEVATANEEALHRTYEQSKKEVQQISRKDYKLQELIREVETNRQLYETFYKRFKETSETSSLKSANARMIDFASVPIHPYKPKKKLTIAISFAVSLMLGVFLAFLLEHLDNTIKSPGDVADRLNMPMLGLVPLIENEKRKEGPITSAFFDKQQSGFAESIRTIRTALLLSGFDHPHKITMVTSSVPGEGKSTLSINLAMALGKMEKTLLIDGDLRNPTIGKSSGVGQKARGLSTLAAGTTKMDESIFRWKEANIDVLPIGIIPPNPLELLSSKRFAAIIDELAKRYDRIVIDSAPVHAVSDPLVLATHVNTIIYVVKTDSTPYPTVQSGIKQFSDVNASIAGVVLNQVDFKKIHRYGDSSYYYGEQGYGQKEGEA